jgi:hypothetical protein
MYVVCFLYVSLDTSTGQLHDSLASRHACACSEAGFGSQNGDRLEKCTTKEQNYVVCFCGQKDLMQSIFINKYFLFVLGSVCHVKRLTTGWQTFRWRQRGWNREAEVAETTVKRLTWCRFRRTGKATWQEKYISSRFKYHMLYVLYPFVTYLLTLPHT